MRIRRTVMALVAFLGLALACRAQQESEAWDPYKAEKAVEIGRYYLKKGNYDAAIERFHDALRFKPKFAVPHLLLGEAYEKKGMPEEALSSYEKYLEILPNAEDSAKVQKRIATLKQAVEKAKSRRKPRS